MIIRAEHKNNYTVIINETLCTPNLSWKAKAILHYLLSKPDNWELQINDLLKHSTDGETSTRSGINELIEKGYIEKKAVRDEKTKAIKSVNYFVFETPTLKNTCSYFNDENLHVENLNVENLNQGFDPLISTNIVNTEKIRIYNKTEFISNTSFPDSGESVKSVKVNQSPLKNIFKGEVEERPCKREISGQSENFQAGGMASVEMTSLNPEGVTSGYSLDSDIKTGDLRFEGAGEKVTDNPPNFEATYYTDKGDAFKAPHSDPFYLTRRKRKLEGKRLDAFNDFWNAFNFKQGKADAADEWLDIPLLSKSVLKGIVDAAKREAEQRPLIISQGRQPKWAAGWIAGRRWEDEPEPASGFNGGFNDGGILFPSLQGNTTTSPEQPTGQVNKTTLPALFTGQKGFTGGYGSVYGNTPMFGQPTPYGFPSTGSRRMDNNLAACQAAIEMRKQISQNQAVNHA